MFVYMVDWFCGLLIAVGERVLGLFGFADSLLMMVVWRAGVVLVYYFIVLICFFWFVAGC